MKIPSILLILLFSCNAGSDDNPAMKPLHDRAANITIIRDNWGIPHVYGKTDADAVFGLMYAQCEESFERVERSYIQRLGRLAEIEGEAYLYEDLETRLIYDTAEAIMDYKNSEPWLKALLLAFADGINYYLEKNPMVKPRLLKRFEPWYPLMFTDGGLTATQTGGATISDIKALYGLTDISTSKYEGRQSTANGQRSTVNRQPSTANGQRSTVDGQRSTVNRQPSTVDANGSNAFAIGPQRSASGNAMLYINPHVNFYFRTEAHMVSEEGLNAYGAVTWGQFFVFQGFNEHCGWMHTSSLADAADLYEESIVRAGNTFFYRYNDSLRRLTTRAHVFKIKSKERPLTITAYYTHHGPVIGSRNGKWLSLREENRSANGLIQSWRRTKSRNYEEFKKTMQLRANNSCNTMYADKDGTIAYWHGNFIPERNSEFNYSQPVDGKIGATEWKGIHQMDQLVHLENPSTGWLQNCNSSPFGATGTTRLDPKKFPAYMAPDGENFRSQRASQLLSQNDSITLKKLIEVGYDRYLAAFDSMLPPLFESYHHLKQSDSLYIILKEPIDILMNWDRYSATSSIATTLAVEWAYKVINLNYYAMSVEDGSNQIALFSSFARQTSIPKRLDLLREVIIELEKIYGTWKMAWGKLVRFQRISGDIIPKFDDERTSTPVGFASALFGCLPAYEAIWNGSDKSYGVAGNSFVAAVEFGKRISAKSIVTAGQSFKPASKHFKDQLQLFLDGKLKDVHFYKEDVIRNKSSSYHPGE